MSDISPYTRRVLRTALALLENDEADIGPALIAAALLQLAEVIEKGQDHSVVEVRPLFPETTHEAQG